MVNTFTSYHLLRYVYQESDLAEKQILEEFLQEDPEAKKEMVMLRNAKRHLPQVLFSAHPKTLGSILEYSRLA